MNTLNPGGSLSVNQELRSNNGLYVLIMQGDGNLVLYEGVMTPPRRAVWSTNTWNLPPERRPNRAAMQQDGNFVLYSTTGAEWASGTWTFPGSRLVLQDDRNLVIYDPNNIARWASNQANLADGALLRDQDKPAVWVMCGGARFLVPSEAEFLAMGYNSAQVQVVPPGTVARIPTVPRDGTIFRERPSEEVYVVYSGRKYHVPNDYALACMSLDRVWVRTLPNGSAASVPTVAFYSPESYEVGATPGSLAGMDKTPGSLVFPPPGPLDGSLFARSDIATTVRLVSQSREVRLIELRGWLHFASTDANAPPGDPGRLLEYGCNTAELSGADWWYKLELDTNWAASRGIDLGRFFKVGDLISHGLFLTPYFPSFNPFKCAVALPRIKMELNSWGWKNMFPVSVSEHPGDWKKYDQAANCGNYVFPFDPVQPPGFPKPLGAGQYVRVVGSLVTDIPHITEDYFGYYIAEFLPFVSTPQRNRRAAAAAWGGGGTALKDEHNPMHPARWNEIHPPDLFQPLKEPPVHQRETVRGVALIADGIAEGYSVEFMLRPPALKPSSSARLSVREHVGPESNLKSITDGNANKTGARIDVLTDRVRVRIGVAREGGFGAAGKFKGIYRVFWDAMGSPTDPPAPARYGRTIKAVHGNTGRTLHSHAINYSHPNSSKQQQVTCFGGLDDNDWWRIKGAHGTPAGHKADQPVLHGDVVRLEHVLTRRNLHSHGGFPSPITRQQEVTCFGTNGVGDGNDDWRVEVKDGGQWTYGKWVRLIHVNTNHALHSHEPYTHPTYTAGQQEVTGFPSRDDNDLFYLFEGG
jgi:MIR domain